MDRDEFMELVYETFADEPDNVLANGIIEAADAYVEYEKAQLSQEGTTSDLIDRQAALDIFDDYNVSVENGELEAYSRDRKRMCELPSAQPERKKGEWSDGYRWQRCSLCKQTGKKSWNYCPHCGAKMKGERQK